jgi:methionyl-tRNA formyltransferase
LNKHFSLLKNELAVEMTTSISSGQRSFNDLRIVFMGTPEFAVSSLDALIKAGMNVVGVVTAPDKAAGRGMKIMQSAVKTYALENNLPVLQPAKLKDPQFNQDLSSLKPDLQIVVAFRMLPEIVWNLPPLGTINVHASLLPHYRGAAPINWAIINGETETGVTTFQLKHEIDTGNILLQEKVQIGETQTAGELHDVLKETGAALLVNTIRKLSEGSIVPQSQAVLIDESLIKHAPKIFTETCKINFQQPTEKVYNLIRGLSPYPGAFTFLNEKMMKIFRAEMEKTEVKDSPGTFLSDRKTNLKVACTDGYVNILELQIEGKKRMSVLDFLKGYRWD